MNGSLFAWLKYMNGVGFEMSGLTSVPEWPSLAPLRSSPVYTTCLLLLLITNAILRLLYDFTCCSLDIKHGSCDCYLMKYCSLDINNTSAVMFDDKRDHWTSVWLETLQSWYTTGQLRCLMTNAIIRLLYDLKYCSLDIQHVSCDCCLTKYYCSLYIQHVSCDV